MDLDKGVYLRQVPPYAFILVINDNVVVLSLKDINLQSVVHSGTCQVTFTARDVGVSIRIRGMVQDGYVRDIDNS